MRHLVSLMARDRIPRLLQRRVAEKLSLPAHRVETVRNKREFQRAERASLFLGLSDGARIDQFRRNREELSNEQFAMNYELSATRAQSMIADLRVDLCDEQAQFEHVFLVDDFAGSGKTILRRNERALLKGRLIRFLDDTLPKLGNTTYPKIYITLYMATEQALEHLRSLISVFPSPCWSDDREPEVITVMPLGRHIGLCHDGTGGEYEADQAFDGLLRKYYDPSVEDEHKGNVLYGFSNCRLPLVLSHNSPNNSVYLLWEKRRALFPRFERHQARSRDE